MTVSNLGEPITRNAFLIFFASHIPITLMVDGQAFFPRHWYPSLVRDTVDWYAATFKDKLMTFPVQTWFSCMVALEVLVELPFFVLAVYVILQRSSSNNDNASTSTGIAGLLDGADKFRSCCLIYGAVTCTTLVPILGCVVSDVETSLMEKATLFGFYLPYFIFPFWLTLIAFHQEDMFGGADKKKSS